MPAWPGLLVAGAIAGLAWIAASALQRGPGPIPALPASPMVLAIILGLVLAGPTGRRPHWAQGLAVARGILLKTAVALIGLRLSLGEVWSLGSQALPMVLIAISVGLGFSLALYRLLGTPVRLAGLLAVGTAICGASAIAALAPAIRASHAETCYAIACIALFGLVATLAYPLLLPLWLSDPAQVGLVMGSAIHDTAQVTAAASAHEQIRGVSGTLDAATVTKLLRNSAMILVIPLAAWMIVGRQSGQRPPFPRFILAFVALAGVRSLIDGAGFGDASSWQAIVEVASGTSQFLFAMAMAALAMAIRLRDLKPLGWRPALGAAVTATAMLVATIMIVLTLRA
ncbi:MAG: YeiH family protein [Wenzhouxiangella sp.]